jgi:DNA helicase-2/ATP-dependent DNA helicase PcrA
VFEEFFEFADGAVLVGHNVGYDVKMIAAHARRLDLQVPLLLSADTWALASRFVQASDYRLGTLASTLGLKVVPTHRARDDVEATVELLRALVPAIRQGATQRRQLIVRYGGVFQSLASQFNSWAEAMASQRPARLLLTILRESGLLDFYRSEPRRLAHLDKLEHIFHTRDDPTLHPETSLRALLEFTSLAVNVDHLSETDNQVVIVTVHQAKGLEFDAVFIAGASEGEIPNYYCKTPEQMEEERRLFYVAMTRAKEKLYISGYRENAWGYPKDLSPFVRAIDRRFVDRIEPRRHLDWDEDQVLPF